MIYIIPKYYILQKIRQLPRILSVLIEY